MTKTAEIEGSNSVTYDYFAQIIFILRKHDRNGTRPVQYFCKEM